MKTVKIATVWMLCGMLLFLSSCFSYTSFDELMSQNGEGTTAYEYKTTSGEQTTAVVSPENTTSGSIIPETTAVQILIPENTTAAPVTQAPEVQTTLPQTTAPQETTTAVQSEEDFSAYSKKQIIDTYADALNKTRGYQGAITATKTESFDAKIKDAHPGGALTELLASNIVKLVGSEGQQTINFSGGYGVDNEGITVPVLLPQNSAFSLPEEGVASAEIMKSGDKTKIRIVLIPETVNMGQVPPYNANSVGYLDTSKLDFKIVTISRVDITYTGSVIDAVIGSNGYVESVTYTVGMSTYAELSGMGISGYGTLEGTQIEQWQLMY